jgi:hypothetical protein
LDFWTILSIRLLYINLAFLLDTIFLQKYQLYHENKQFYSFEQIQEKLETNNFLMFYRLIARIPKAFKDCLKENLLDIPFDTHDTTDTCFIEFAFVNIVFCKYYQ